MSNNTIKLTIPVETEKVTFVIEIPKPHPDEVTKYSDWFNNKAEKDNYLPHEYEKDLKGPSDNKLTESVLKKVFRENALNSNLSELERIIIKVTLLNEYYSTRIRSMDLIPIARQILALNIDDKLEESVKNNKANCDLVNAIAYFRGSVNKHDKVNAAYSFASKYCSWHYPKIYPIIDSYAKGLLYYINEALEKPFIEYKSLNENKNYKNRRDEFLNDYNNYYKAYKKFITLFELDGFEYKTIDEYLWSLAQDKLSDSNCMVVKDGEEPKYYSEYIKEVEEYNEKAKRSGKSKKTIIKYLSQIVKMSGEYGKMYSKLYGSNDRFKEICDESLKNCIEDKDNIKL